MKAQALVSASGLVVLLLFHVSTAVAQGSQSSWSWPEKAKNLQVLPADSPPDRLRAVMMGFTRSLGVRCTHCHVGEEGKPLSTYDFAADTNPKKDVARGMLRMLGTINDQLKTIQPEKVDRVNMWCHTCHRGRPLPMTLAEELGRVYKQQGSDSTVARYQDLRARFFGAGAYDFREPALNEVGYVALASHDARGAVSILQLNAQQFPESGNARDSLGEAYLAAGDTTQALIQYEKALELDPKNENAAKVLAALKGAGKVR